MLLHFGDLLGGHHANVHLLRRRLSSTPELEVVDLVILVLVLLPYLFLLLLLSGLGVLFVLVAAIDADSFPILAGLDLLGCILV